MVRVVVVLHLDAGDLAREHARQSRERSRRRSDRRARRPRGMRSGSCPPRRPGRTRRRRACRRSAATTSFTSTTTAWASRIATWSWSELRSARCSCTTAAPRPAHRRDAEHRNGREQHEQLEHENVLVGRRCREQPRPSIGAPDGDERDGAEPEAHRPGAEAQRGPDQHRERRVQQQRELPSATRSGNEKGERAAKDQPQQRSRSLRPRGPGSGAPSATWRRRLPPRTSGGRIVSPVRAFDRNHAVHGRQYVAEPPCSTTFAAPDGRADSRRDDHRGEREAREAVDVVQTQLAPRSTRRSMTNRGERTCDICDVRQRAPRKGSTAATRRASARRRATATYQTQSRSGDRSQRGSRERRTAERRPRSRAPGSASIGR